jgi:hypothetical protein
MKIVLKNFYNHPHNETGIFLHPFPLHQNTVLQLIGIRFEFKRLINVNFFPNFHNVLPTFVIQLYVTQKGDRGYMKREATWSMNLIIELNQF